MHIKNIIKRLFFSTKGITGNVIRDGKIGYRDIPKTACTSIKIVLYSLQFNKDFERSNHGGKHIHQVMASLNQPLNNAEFKFIVVRDPIKRFLSAYANRVIFHKELSFNFISKNHPDLLDEIKVFDPDLNQFIKYLDTYLKIKTIRHHIKPISNFLNGNDLTYFTNVYKLENLHELEKDLSNISGKKVVFGRFQTGGPKIKINELSSEQFKKLLNFYAKDYELLAGLYEKPKL